MSNERQLQEINTQLAAIRGQLQDLREAVADVRGLVGPFGVKIDDDQLLVQTLYGVKYLVDPHDLIMTPQLIVYRQWEADLSRFFNTKVTPDTVFVDIGANFGYFTCLAGSRIGPSGSGRVYAVEPNPALVKLLRANTLINWSMCPIEVHPVALGAVDRVVQLSIPSDRAANGSLTAGDPSSERVVDVPMVRLDDLVPAGTAVDLVKLDVEGHEYGVLAGAARVIAESPSIQIVMEWSSRQMIDAGYSIDAMLGQIDGLGLRMMRLSDVADRNRYEAYPVHTLDAYSYDNVLLVRQ
jgi:FkbM family methyltransferase